MSEVKHGTLEPLTNEENERLDTLGGMKLCDMTADQYFDYAHLRNRREYAHILAARAEG